MAVIRKVPLASSLETATVLVNKPSRGIFLFIRRYERNEKELFLFAWPDGYEAMKV